MTKIPVLDHGYVALVEAWGSDERIVEAARMSTDKGFQGWGTTCGACNGRKTQWRSPTGHFSPTGQGQYGEPIEGQEVECIGCKGTGGIAGDEKLLRYLYEHRHMTPFEMGGMTIEVQAPIFVFREWHRHRTQSYNELSARYTPLPDVNYVPTVERVMQRNVKNKQAMSRDDTLDAAKAALFLVHLQRDYKAAEGAYQEALSSGVPKELARLCIPVGRYSRMRASANLRNWLQFLTLRMDEAAQWEIRQYANVVGTLIATAFPRTWELFNVKRI